jgi:leader peptidase (prepilin peptidase)/N-methyltransferase
MVVGTRRPLNKSIVKPASHCDNCHHTLKWYELIPIFSFIIQKGRCRKCHIKLSIFYPCMELLTGLLFLFSYLRFGFTNEFLIALLIASLLIIIIVSDFKYFIILDGPLVIAVILFFIDQVVFFNLEIALMGLLRGLAIMTLVFLIKKLGDVLFKRESLGGGDIKLAFVFGMILGIRLSLVNLVIASFLAFPYAFYCLLSKKEKEIPYGPFLATAFYLIYLFSSVFLTFLNYGF